MEPDHQARGGIRRGGRSANGKYGGGGATSATGSELSCGADGCKEVEDAMEEEMASAVGSTPAQRAEGGKYGSAFEVCPPK